MPAPRTTTAFRRSHRGFTLVELLVAIAVMALMAILSWRGLDGMSRAQTQTLARSDEVLVLQAGLAQWKSDLDAMTASPQVIGLDWDGRVLRITRRGSAGPSDGMRVAAWTRRTDAGGILAALAVATFDQPGRLADLLGTSAELGTERRRRGQEAGSSRRSTAGLANLLLPRWRLEQSPVQRRVRQGNPVGASRRGSRGVDTPPGAGHHRSLDAGLGTSHGGRWQIMRNHRGAALLAAMLTVTLVATLAATCTVAAVAQR
jgi:prepilin-type N-terminal cleavage/methylation domain-containing protein